jgi:catechol 2,3-dioxygenase-like lactoylglutathione lyase family enzyme
MELKPIHTGITVDNMEEALKWYRDNLSFELVSDKYVEPLHIRICFVQNGDFQLELFQHDRGKPVPDYRKELTSDLQVSGTKHIAFGVSDLNALKEQFCANGVDIAAEMGDDVLFIRDNSGVLLEFNQI